MSSAEILLGTVPGWSSKHVEILESNWITTANQVVAIAATASGLSHMAEQLGVNDREMKKLVDLARQALPSEVAADLEREADTSQFPLGARLDPPTKR